MNRPQNNVGLSSLQVDQEELSGSILDLFSPPSIESHMIKGKDILIQPINPLSDSGPVEFQINSSNEEYLFMPFTRLIGKLKIVKINSDGVEQDCTSSDDFRYFITQIR